MFVQSSTAIHLCQESEKGLHHARLTDLKAAKPDSHTLDGKQKETPYPGGR